MRTQMTKLTAVAAMAIELALGTAGATTAATSVPCAEQLEAGGGVGNARPTVIGVRTDGDGAPPAGYMVGRFFVGFHPE